MFNKVLFFLILIINLNADTNPKIEVISAYRENEYSGYGDYFREGYEIVFKVKNINAYTIKSISISELNLSYPSKEGSILYGRLYVIDENTLLISFVRKLDLKSLFSVKPKNISFFNKKDEHYIVSDITYNDETFNNTIHQAKKDYDEFYRIKEIEESKILNKIKRFFN